ncbi:iron-containing alcohol dehydrogenase family protein [Desulfosporosinus sp. OT]|uniref:iron-containing alcohol dehydrogenase family protein n=1 Tax=Desulfosporosinus sp. OT TaxID=913865 RepID=UPI000223A1A0|nr:iron-containing alcohol dehydrogenase family protein [Desulfosporosinus sp. OT]EGW37947.1 iron-containing alcohol dehydrogenase family protein [Desulfosporosinus sp. OT]
MTNKFYMPTRVIIGDDCITKNSELFIFLGKKALIVTGAQSAKRNGSEKDVKTALESVGINYLVFDKVMSNPTIACVYEGATLAKENGVDFIIAIGGGSPMDAGKAIALLAAQDIEEENLFSGNYEKKVLPMAFVPTTAGTGSEVTQYSILTNDKAQTKTSIASDLLFPTVTFLDAKYTEQLAVTTTINTAIDALSHAVEGMLSVRASNVSDALAVASIRMIMNCVPDMLQALLAGSEVVFNLKQREQLLQASLMAGMVIAQTGTTVVHAMGYSLTYFKNIDHGRANGLLLGEYLKLVENVQPDLAGSILAAMNFSEADQFGELMNKLLGDKEEISSEEIKRYSKIAIQTKNIANSVVKPTEEELRTMYALSFVK